MKKRKFVRKIPVDDVFETEQIDLVNCDSILSFAESLGKEDEKFRLGYLKTRRERIEEKNEFIYDQSVDSPDRVVGSFKDKFNNLMLKVTFKQRSNGIIPDPTLLSVKFIAVKYPQFLIDYYESLLK